MVTEASWVYDRVCYIWKRLRKLDFVSLNQPAFCDRASELVLEILVVHTMQELWSDLNARGRANHRIDWALRALRCLAVINPFRNVSEGKDRKAVEAAANRTALQFHTIENGMLVSCF
jgi:hypothetical protein